MLTNITQDQEFMNGLKILCSLDSYSKKKLSSTPVDLKQKFNPENSWSYYISIPKVYDGFSDLSYKTKKGTPFVTIEYLKRNELDCLFNSFNMEIAMADDLKHRPDPKEHKKLKQIVNRAYEKEIIKEQDDFLKQVRQLENVMGPGHFMFPITLESIVKNNNYISSEVTKGYSKLFVNLVKAVK